MRSPHLGVTISIAALAFTVILQFGAMCIGYGRLQARVEAIQTDVQRLVQLHTSNEAKK